MSKLAAALLAAQKAMPALHKDSKATVPTKTGGQFSYKYLSLQGLLEVVLPVLNENGLALSQMPSLGPDGTQVLTTTLFHGETDERLVGETPLLLNGAQTPQTWGGAITYARRYALTALLGIAADEDDDGAQASAPPARRQPGKLVFEQPASANVSMSEVDVLVTKLAGLRGVEETTVRNSLEGAAPAEALAKLRGWVDRAERAKAGAAA